MSLKVTLMDGSVVELPQGSTPMSVAERLSGDWVRRALAARVNGRGWDLNRPLPGDCTVQILREDQPEGLEVMRHSAAHILAAAVRRLFGPGVRFGYGPAVEDGFYYDMQFPDGVRVTEEDLPKIEAECLRIVEARLPFERREIPREEALARMRELGQPFKVETLEKDLLDPVVSLYVSGDFTDLCEGPHVPTTGHVRALKLTRVTGAYWKGDARNPMLTRLYGTAWPSRQALEEHLRRLEEARKRDHRRLGQDLELFMFHEWSPGAVFFLPRGTVIYNELLAFLREEYRKRGYQEVVTPQLFNKALWELSGHWEHYRENMFLLRVDEEEFSLKPMNCPGHVLMFNHRRRSYRELPMRIADFCPIHRNEVRGVLGGMTRVRKFEQDDAHIFCSEDQVESEIAREIDFVNRVFREVFRMPFTAKLSTRPAQFLGEVEAWNRAEAALEAALRRHEIPFTVSPGEGAFYGPKIDFDIRDALGRPWQLSTIQLDFQLPRRMGAEYEGPDGRRHIPVMIHRAILGSLERFIAILTEHYGGDFPLWLAPTQVVVLSVTEKEAGYARGVQDRLREAGVRSEIDLSADRISYKIRAAEVRKVPYMAVVGAREAASGTVAVRERRKGDRGPMKVEAFVDHLRREIAAKSAL